MRVHFNSSSLHAHGPASLQQYPQTKNSATIDTDIASIKGQEYVFPSPAALQ